MKKIMSMFLAAMLVGSIYPHAFAERTEYNIYVAKWGSDSNPGTLDKPLASIQAAKKAVNNAKATMKTGSIYVNIAEGDYNIDSTVSFTSSDSGSSSLGIVYRPMEGAKVTFTGCHDLDISTFKPVTDDTQRARLQSDVRSKVGVLDLKANGITHLDEYLRPPRDSHTGTPFWTLFIDDQAQTIARYPNEGFAKISDVISAGSQHYNSTLESKLYNEKPIIFETGLERTANWKTATDAVIEGYYKWDWSYEVLYVDKINEKNQIVTKWSNTCYGIVPGARYRIVNLMEEIDTPGEFYVDRDNMLLYFYTPFPLTKDMSVQLSTLTKDMFSVKNCDNITFERLNFAKSRGNAFSVVDCSNVSFKGCKFQSLGQEGIYVNSNDIHIQSCDFAYIGGNCIELTGGNRYSLVPSNNIVENCTFYKYSQVASTYTNAVKSMGCGNIVRNNLIHSAPHQGIWYSGNDHQLVNNEIYDVLKETEDCGAIYAGRDYGSLGDVIAYNYIHDIDYSTSIRGRTPSALSCNAIYMDDMMTGTTIHHNVCANVPKAMMIGGGRDMNIYDNISYNNVCAWNLDARACTGDANWFATSQRNGEAWNKTNIYPVTGSTWISRYPAVKGVLYVDLQYPAGNDVHHNLTYHTDETYVKDNIVKEFLIWSKVHDNYEYKNDDIFVDPAGQNFEIKSQSVLELMPGLSKIKMDEIGIYEDEYRKSIKGEPVKFKKIAPKKDYVGIDNLKYFFSWENPLGADRFRVIIATDPELKNVVKDVYCRDNHTTITGLQSRETTYYWDVIAYVNGRTTKSEYFSGEGASAFTTTKYEQVDRKAFDSDYKKACDILATMREGSATGEYQSGSIEFVKNIIETARVYAEEPHPYQVDLDEQTQIMEDAFHQLSGMINTGYVNFNDLLARGAKWESRIGNVEQTADSVTVTGKDATAGSWVANPEPHEVMAFKLKMNRNGQWSGLTLRQTLPHSLPYTSDYSSYCYFVIFKDNQLELQRFVAGSSDAMLEVKENTFFENNVEYEVTFGAIDTPEGVRIILTCNGETVFDYVDTEKPIWTNGSFCVCNINAEGYVTVSKSDNPPTGRVFE